MMINWSAPNQLGTRTDMEFHVLVGKVEPVNPFLSQKFAGLWPSSCSIMRLLSLGGALQVVGAYPESLQTTTNMTS